MTTNPAGMTPILPGEAKELCILVTQLIIPEQRENALVELSKKRESYPDLAPVLWHSFGAITALLQEIVGIYPMLSPPTLTPQASNRVCNALALLQCVASHAETKNKLVKTQIPLYLYPFLNTVSRQRPFEYLRLTSLGVIGALVKVDDPEIVHFLLQTEIIPLSLRIMETGTELSKTVATFIVQKILLDDNGLQHICSTAERFYAVTSVLANMVTKLIEAPSARLLKHIVRCYLRLSENPKAREPLRGCLPETLKDQTFANAISQEDSVQRWLQTLLKNLSGDATPQPATGAVATPAAPGAMTPSGPPPGVTLPSTATATAGNGPPPALTKPVGLPNAKAWGANA